MPRWARRLPDPPRASALDVRRSRRFGCFPRQKKAPQKPRKTRAGSRAMPLRRRRDGPSIQARTEEQSPGRVRVSSRQKAPRSLRRCRPSRGGIQERPRPERRATRSTRPRHDSSRRRGCPERHEKGTRESSKNARTPLLERPDPRTTSSTPSGTRRAKAVACRPWLAGPRCGNASEGPTQPAPVGAGEQRGESLTRVRGSIARRVCPRVESRLQKSASFAEAQRSTPPAGNGACGRGSGPRRSKRSSRMKRRRRSGSRRPSRSPERVRSRALERALRGDGPCSMEDTSGHCGSAHVHASARRVISAAFERAHARASGVPITKEATGVPEVRFSRGPAGRQRPPERLSRENVEPTEANRPEREAGDLLDRAGAQSA